MKPLKDIDDLGKKIGNDKLLAVLDAAQPLAIESAVGVKARPWEICFASSALTSGELQATPITPRRLLMGDWFKACDLGFIFAPRGRGKTWLSMLLADKLANGGEMGPWRAGDPATVLYIDGEMAVDSVKERDAALASGPDGGRLIYINHEIVFERTGRVLSLADIEAQQGLTRYCLERSIDVLVLDNLSCLFPGVGENDNDEWTKVLPWLLDLRRRKIAVVIVHHAGRNGAMRGGSKREDAAAWIISLDDSGDTADVKNGAKFISRFTKNRNAQHEPPACEWTFAPGADGKTNVTWREASALDVLRQWIRDGITGCDDLAKEMGISKGQVSKLAKRGMDAGWLKKDGRDYELCEP